MTGNEWYRYDFRTNNLTIAKRRYRTKPVSYIDKIWWEWNTNSSTTTSYTTPVYDNRINWTTTGSSLYDDITWHNWMVEPRPLRRYKANIIVPRPRTPEEIAEEQRRRQLAVEEAERRVREQRLAREEAAARARILLAEVLSPEQAAEFAAHDRFHVTSNLGNRFVILLGRQHNVFQVDRRGRRIMEFCAHIGEHVPDEDNVLAQKLLIETDEEVFRRIANKWRLEHGPDGLVTRETVRRVEAVAAA